MVVHSWVAILASLQVHFAGCGKITPNAVMEVLPPIVARRLMERAPAAQRKAAAPFDAAASYSQQVELD
jgi:hypothetical protein